MEKVEVRPNLWVTECGKVFGLRGQRKTPTGKVGYPVVSYQGAMLYVHRLVAEAFIENPDGKPQVAHNDGTRTNNHVSNLRWATAAENQADRVGHGTANRCSQNPQARLSLSDVEKIRQLRADKTPVAEIAAAYGVSTWTIYDACNPNRTWKDIE